MKPIGMKKIDFPSASDFSLNIKYTQTDKKTHFHEIDMHTHSECELYLNITGDVSFMVENKIYPVTHGDVIIVRPGEQHHCIYNSDSDTKHKFFWMLIEYDKNNPFFKNLINSLPLYYISPPENEKNELIDICKALYNGNVEYEEKFCLFFKMIHILTTSKSVCSNFNTNIPEDVYSILRYIDNHISETIKISTISKELYISNSTIERRFTEYFGMTPLKFIQKRKIIHAAALLRNGKTVLEAGLEVGYADNSYFIKLFKEHYGTTPFNYKKDNANRLTRL